MSNFLYKYKIISMIAALWAMTLTTYATFQMFVDISVITAASVSAYTALLGLPAVGLGIWKWRNSNVAVAPDDRK